MLYKIRHRDGLIWIQLYFRHKQAIIMPSKSILQLKIKINKKVENVTCLEYAGLNGGNLSTQKISWK